MRYGSPSNSASDAPAGWPVMLRVAGRRCVVVGGGPVAVRRASSLVAGGAEVVVVAPAMDERLDTLMIERAERGYETGDLDGAFLVVVATDNPAVNQRVADDAEAAGVLVNRADDAAAVPRAGSGGGDFTVMAHEARGPLTVAVDTGRTSASAAKAIRAELFDALDEDWITLLVEARPWRVKIQRSADPAARSARLRRLTGETAMRTLKDQGVSALRAYLKTVAEGRAD